MQALDCLMFLYSLFKEYTWLKNSRNTLPPPHHKSANVNVVTDLCENSITPLQLLNVEALCDPDDLVVDGDELVAVYPEPGGLAGGLLADWSQGGGLQLTSRLFHVINLPEIIYRLI